MILFKIFEKYIFFFVVGLFEIFWKSFLVDFRLLFIEFVIFCNLLVLIWLWGIDNVRLNVLDISSVFRFVLIKRCFLIVWVIVFLLRICSIVFLVYINWGIFLILDCVVKCLLWLRKFIFIWRLFSFNIMDFNLFFEVLFEIIICVFNYNGWLKVIMGVWFVIKESVLLM